MEEPKKKAKPKPEWRGFVTVWQIGRKPETLKMGRIIERCSFEDLMIHAARKYDGVITEPYYTICSEHHPHTGIGASVVDVSKVLSSKGNPAQVHAMCRLELTAEISHLTKRDDDYMVRRFVEAEAAKAALAEARRTSKKSKTPSTKAIKAAK